MHSMLIVAVTIKKNMDASNGSSKASYIRLFVASSARDLSPIRDDLHTHGNLAESVADIATNISRLPSGVGRFLARLL